MGLREDAAESRMKKKVEEGSLLLPPFNLFFFAQESCVFKSLNLQYKGSFSQQELVQHELFGFFT
jgi:hypothetical protein